MKLRATNGLLQGWTGEGIITADYSAASYGVPVLLIEGEPVGTLEAALAGYVILSATPEERELLVVGGYDLRDGPIA